MSQVLHRTHAIETLEPEAALQYKLFWNAFHMHAEANHEFNRQLVARLGEPLKPPSTSQQRWRHTHLWKQMLGR